MNRFSTTRSFLRVPVWLRIAATGIVFGGALSTSPGQQQFRGTCARVKIEIRQTLTTERIGFEATLRVTNNQSEEAVTDFSARLTFEDPVKTAEAGKKNDASDFFFVRQPNLEGISGINGEGVISPTKTAVVRWFIIPKPDAGGTEPQGRVYRVGCELGGKMGGIDIPQEQYFVIPDSITVKPEPRLDITYFQPRDVQGDDPFTPEVESPIPFTLGVLVKNTGYAPAKKVAINSEQPKIVENKRGLLLVAQLLGARVQDSPLDKTSLTVDLGDIPPGEARKGAWDMITSLSGEFIEFKASYTHAAELGGEETSLIESLEAHFIAAEVLNDEPGRDAILDFLADADRDEERMPDALYESNGNVLPVNTVLDTEVGELQGREFTVILRPDVEGWGYARLEDPGQAKYGIEEVIRSDGKVLNLHNVWTNIRYHPLTNKKLTYLNIFDRLEIGEYSYDCTYASAPDDTDPPVTELRFVGEVTREGDDHYITRDTQMYFISEDINAVSIYYKVDNGDFRPGLPFSFDDPGTYEVIYYAEDAAGNVEPESFARLIITGAGPGFDAVTLAEEALFLKGDVLSARTDAARIEFTATTSPTRVDASIDIFAGAKAFPVVAGAPLDPSPLTELELTVAGANTDFYRYRVNGGAWSTEAPSGSPLNLTGLAGTVELDVMGRSEHGGWPDEAEAVRFVWTVDSSAPAARLDGLGGIPLTNSDRVLDLDGEGFTEYRWTYNGGYFRAPLAKGESFALEALPSGPLELAFDTDADGDLDGEADLVLSLPVDPAYGSDFSELPMVYCEVREDIGGDPQTLSWAGRDNDGIPQRPGWYTVRVQLRNLLGQSGFFTRLVRIEDLSGAPGYVTAPENEAKALHARGNLAVWQQREGTDWDILMLDLADPAGAPMALTADAVSQQAPHTDGRWVVWQGRRPNLSTDIYAWDSANPGDAPLRLTDTLDMMDIEPVVAWPWVVWQERPLGVEEAPQQLRAWNLVEGSGFMVDPTTQDQEQASIHAGRVVWRDFRDVGNGEIYFADLETGERRRLTVSVHGQFFPAIRGRMVVWQDNRDGQVDLYGYDLAADGEWKVTDTSYNEAHPYLVDRFVLYEEDSLDPERANLRIHDLMTGLSVPLTRSDFLNEYPVEAGGYLLWQQRDGPLAGDLRLQHSPLPALQLIADNANAVPVTPALADRFADAFSLLEAWQDVVGVADVARFTEWEPEPVRETAVWDEEAAMATGTNFPLVTGSFLWVRFGEAVALDLGEASDGDLSLEAGLNVITHTGFPAEYSAYELVEGLGPEKVGAVRMLDARAGLWHSIVVSDVEGVLGPNFRIPATAVVFIQMKEAVASWNPRRDGT